MSLEAIARQFNGDIAEIILYNTALNDTDRTAVENYLIAKYGIAPDISPSPSSLAFGSVNVGTSSSAQTVTVTNTGTDNLIIGTLAIAGTDLSQFSKPADTCSGQTIAPSAECTVQVVFSPTSAGAKTASLDIPSNDPDTPTASVTLSGTGQYTYYCDNDNDTYRNETVSGTCSVTGCVPAGCTTTPGADCNDGNSAINPNSIWYPDADGDGYGNPSAAYPQCSTPTVPPGRFVLNNTDANDSDPNIYPGGPSVRVSGTTTTYYSTLQAAYNAAAEGNIIQVQAVSFTGNLSINLNKTVTLRGGYNNIFSTVTGKTNLTGNLTISNGKVTIENIELKK